MDEALTLDPPALLQRLPAQADAEPVREADRHEALRERFVSPCGLNRANVAPAHDLRDPDHRTRFVDGVVALDPCVAGAPLEITHAGGVVFVAMVQATTIGAIAVTLMCLIVLRSLRKTLALLLPRVIAGLLLVGAMAWLDLPFTYADVIDLPLIFGLGVDSRIHFAVRKREAQRGSVYATSTPRAVIFSGLTTALAFLRLALSPHQGAASMGELHGLFIAVVLVTTIVLVTTFVTVTTIVAVPTLLEVLKLPPQRSPRHGPARWGAAFNTFSQACRLGICETRKIC